MRKVLAAVAAVAALGATSALAASMTNSKMMNKTTGTIQSIDRSTDQITLHDGSTYTVVRDVSLAGLKTGEKVSITYSQSGKTMNATQVKPAP